VLQQILNHLKVFSEVSDQEKILASVYGIISKFRTGVEVMGTGTVNHPENTLMVTNGHILIILIPMGGDGKSINGMDMTMANTFLNKKAIIEKGEALIKEKTAKEIALSNSLNVSIHFNEVELVKVKTGFLNRGITIKTKAGKKYSYAIQDKEGLTKIKEILVHYIPNVK
jgi:hypothetical protein